MPLLSTRGAASARGFGFSGGRKAIPPSFITLLVDNTGGAGSQSWGNVSQSITEIIDGSGDIYLGWRPNNATSGNAGGQLLVSKINSTGVVQFNRNFAPNNYPTIISTWTTWNRSLNRLVASGRSFTSATYAGAFFTMNASGTVIAGNQIERDFSNNAVSNTGDMWFCAPESFSNNGVRFFRTNTSLVPVAAYNAYTGTTTQKDGYIAGIDSSGNVWATAFNGDYSAGGPYYDLIRIGTGGNMTFWNCYTAFGGIGFSKGTVGATKIYLPAGGSSFGVVNQANPASSPVKVSATGINVTAIAEDASGSIYLVGTSGSFGVIAKCTPSYNVLWASKISCSTPSCYLNSVTVSDDGNSIFVTGVVGGDTVSGYALAMKVSTLGFGPGNYAVSGAVTLSVTPTTVSLSTSSVSLSTYSPSTGTTLPSPSASTTLGTTNGFQSYRYA